MLLSITTLFGGSLPSICKTSWFLDFLHAWYLLEGPSLFQCLLFVGPSLLLMCACSLGGTSEQRGCLNWGGPLFCLPDILPNASSSLLICFRCPFLLATSSILIFFRYYFLCCTCVALTIHLRVLLIRYWRPLRNDTCGVLHAHSRGVALLNALGTIHRGHGPSLRRCTF